MARVSVQQTPDVIMNPRLWRNGQNSNKRAASGENGCVTNCVVAGVLAGDWRLHGSKQPDFDAVFFLCTYCVTDIVAVIAAALVCHLLCVLAVNIDWVDMGGKQEVAYLTDAGMLSDLFQAFPTVPGNEYRVEYPLREHTAHQHPSIYPCV